ncbi:16S rRNA (guanine(527)-N(7))-methyltransferase RsmG [Prevotella sp. oral taxon 317]|uniref:16S rRNA (guanine(527)-N(7))-methyltransferase RsmG n=1 Tax=Prevotella sp. oral taxon 317 TaxID=652721 RepID=UPI0001C40244|nr:16S rRNA (guanine(527)-N(7))-methyltransferase RsmG [Prevotella sp. oral taxon 317]EFC68719.1 16S rRNA methyltransferase GidB [Prevotella sp. oral taxon 317 str. F0108]
MDEIRKYFTELTATQLEQLTQLGELYRTWNERINVVSRKDIDNLYLHHVLHSLAIAKYVQFKAGTRVLDFGTGGGFPGIPLAIVFPECRFKLIDRTAKKIRVTQEIAAAIGLTNATAEQKAGEEEWGEYDFVVSRAVMPLPDLMKIVKKNISREQRNALPNGLICLKGGNLDAETRTVKKVVDITPVGNWFEDEWFEEKNVVYVPM